MKTENKYYYAIIIYYNLKERQNIFDLLDLNCIQYFYEGS